MEPQTTYSFRVIVGSTEIFATLVSYVAVEINPGYLIGGGSATSSSTRGFQDYSRVRVELPLSLTGAPCLEEWWSEIIDARKTLKKKMLEIIQLNSEGRDIGGIRLKNAWPCKWGIRPLFRNKQSTLSLQYYEFTFDELERKDSLPATTKNYSNDASHQKAASQGKSERRDLLENAYRNYPSFDRKPRKIRDHISGANLERPIKSREVKPGQRFIKYERINENPSMYAAPPGYTPDELGIAADGRIQTMFVVEEPFTVIESTAAPFPTGLVPGVGGAGGGTQWLLPPDWARWVRKMPGRIRVK